jgi:opine dehydrogenase
MSETIAVIGAGSTGHAIAAHLTLLGFNVTLSDQKTHEPAMKAILDRGGIAVRGGGLDGFVQFTKVTTSIDDAVSDADVVIIAVLATRHDEIAEACVPHLRKGQVVVITPGNAGSLVFSEKLRNHGKKEVLLAEVEGNLYPCRLTGPAEVLFAFPARRRYISAFPTKHTNDVIRRLAGMYDLAPAANIFETTLNAPNVIVHLPGTLLNAGAVERMGKEYCLYRDGLSSAVITVMNQVFEERATLLKALGYASRHSLDLIRRLYRYNEFPELDTFRKLSGPTSMQHRYISEDAAVGVPLMISLGKLAGVPMPTTRSLLHLASTINKRDYLNQGRTLKNLKLDSLSLDELHQFLAIGTYAKGEN